MSDNRELYGILRSFDQYCMRPLLSLSSVVSTWLKTRTVSFHIHWSFFDIHFSSRQYGHWRRLREKIHGEQVLWHSSWLPDHPWWWDLLAWRSCIPIHSLSLIPRTPRTSRSPFPVSSTPQWSSWTRTWPTPSRTLHRRSLKVNQMNAWVNPKSIIHLSNPLCPFMSSFCFKHNTT